MEGTRFEHLVGRVGTLQGRSLTGAGVDSWRRGEGTSKSGGAHLPFRGEIHRELALRCIISTSQTISHC